MVSCAWVLKKMAVASLLTLEKEHCWQSTSQQMGPILEQLDFFFFLLFLSSVVSFLVFYLFLLIQLFSPAACSYCSVGTQAAADLAVGRAYAGPRLGIYL